MINDTSMGQREIWVHDGNQTHDLPNTGWAPYPLGCTGSIPVGDSDFFFVQRSRHVDQFTFNI